MGVSDSRLAISFANLETKFIIFYPYICNIGMFPRKQEEVAYRFKLQRILQAINVIEHLIQEQLANENVEKNQSSHQRIRGDSDYGLQMETKMVWPQGLLD